VAVASCGIVEPGETVAASGADFTTLKDFEVRFGKGQDVLNAYWGYLSDGGLVIEDRAELEVGDAVSLNICIESSRARYALAGKVVRRQSDSGQAVIAFDPGQPHDLLLSEALAETDNVPARRHRRYRVELSARLSAGLDSAAIGATVVNISSEGCCVRLAEPDRGRLGVGTRVDIAAADFTITGQVVWQRGAERGVRFGVGDAAPTSLVPLHSYLEKLAHAW
jgi:hypothetical protein